MCISVILLTKLSILSISESKVFTLCSINLIESLSASGKKSLHLFEICSVINLSILNFDSSIVEVDSIGFTVSVELDDDKLELEPLGELKASPHFSLASLFKTKFYQFWENIQDQFNGNNHLFILLKIKYVNNDFVSIGKVQRLNKTDKNWYIDFVIENMKFKTEYYNETQIESIIFSYGFKKGTVPDKNKINLNIKSMAIKNISLPISLIPSDFGRVTNTLNIENGKLFIVQNKNGETVMISNFNTYNEVEYLKNGISLIKFKDEFISNDKFVRIIDNKNIISKMENNFWWQRKWKLNS